MRRPARPIFLNSGATVTAVTCPCQFSPSPSALSEVNSWKNRYNGYFVDLFVRKSNRVAINMYNGMEENELFHGFASHSRFKKIRFWIYNLSAGDRLLFRRGGGV